VPDNYREISPYTVLVMIFMIMTQTCEASKTAHRVEKQLDVVQRQLDRMEKAAAATTAADPTHGADPKAAPGNPTE
jgi:hypothetical protein